MVSPYLVLVANDNPYGLMFIFVGFVHGPFFASFIGFKVERRRK
jgi:hypothetical protein